MNERDPEYLAALQRHYAKEHAFPSYDKLLPVLGVAARSAVKTILERLAKQGFLDFVVARVDGHFTLKELVIEKGRRALIAHNPAYPLILPDGDLDIVGVVVALTRKIAR
jgi:hypothetical protein